MIRYTGEGQMSLEGFILPFGGSLNQENWRVKSKVRFTWDKLAKGYHTSLTADHGWPTKTARVVTGAVMFTKHKLVLSNEQTVMQFQENPYLQYFIRLTLYQEEPAITPTLFVEIRRRVGSEVFAPFWTSNPGRDRKAPGEAEVRQGEPRSVQS